MNRCLSILAIVIALSFTGDESSADERIQYGRDVRPILARYCLACHGPDEAARKADLRLDLRDSATQMLRTIDTIGSQASDQSQQRASRLGM